MKGMLQRLQDEPKETIPPLLKHMVSNVGKNRVRTESEMFAFLDALYTQFGKRILKWMRSNACSPAPEGTLRCVRKVHKVVPRGLPFKAVPREGGAIQDPRAVQYFKWVAKVRRSELKQLPDPVPDNR